MTDVWGSLLHGGAAFLHSAAVSVVGTTARDTKALVDSLHDGADANSKEALKRLKTDIETLSNNTQALVNAVKQHLATVAAEVGNMGAEVSKPFTWAALADTMRHLALAMQAMDQAIGAIADTVASREPVNGAAVRQAIRGIAAPWAKPFQLAGQGAAADFDEFFKTLFGVDDATRAIGKSLRWADASHKKVIANLVNIPSRNFGAMSFEESVLEAYLDYSGRATLGFTLKTTVTAQIASADLLTHALPSDAAKSEGQMISLDTENGLTFGEGKDKSILLPMPLGGGLAELRDLTLSTPQDGPRKDQLQITATVAGKQGEVVAVVAEGLGASLDPDDGFVAKLRAPDGLGIAINAGIVRGGGYLRYREVEKDFGGVIDLKIGPISATAVGLFTTEPTSFIVVIGVRFIPVIDLSFGFTLNGVGGLVAINRMLVPDALVTAMSDGAVSNLLFPDDPVKVAPTILQQLSTIFPYRDGGFVAGPMLELGWGSQTGLITAKLGVIISVPGDAPVTVIGSVNLSVPPKLTGAAKYKLIDLNADISAFITSTAFVTRIELRNSSFAKIGVSGTLGIYVGWGADADIVFSAGGFFPKYEPPKMLANMKRLALDLKPPIPAVQFSVDGYAAFTTNSVQFGGSAHLRAKIGPVRGEGDIQVDALFQWAPKLYFAYQMSAHVAIKAFGVSVASVGFSGTLEGTTPWRIQGYAQVSLLVAKAKLPIGPKTWGDVDDVPPPILPIQDALVEALQDPDSWRADIPEGVQKAVVLRQGDAAQGSDAKQRLAHPYANIDLTQQIVPLETGIERVGNYRPDYPRYNLSDAKVGAAPAPAVSELTGMFAPGQFLNLSDDEKMARPAFETLPAGARIAGSYGAKTGAVSSAAYAWESFFPQTDERRLSIAFPLNGLNAAILASGLLARQNAHATNRYLSDTVTPIAMADAGQMILTDRATMSVAGVAATGLSQSYTTVAQERAEMGTAAASLQLVTAGQGL
jgi:hypothetical protein